MRTHICLALGLLASLWLVPVGAAELQAMDLDDQGKKLIITFEFSEAVEYEKLSYFDANFLSLTIPGLKLTNRQLNGYKLVGGEDLKPYYKHVKLNKADGGGELRVYMGKKTTPADALPMNRGTVVEVEIVKPTWISDAPVEVPSEPSENFIPDDPVPVEPDPVEEPPVIEPDPEPVPVVEPEPVVEPDPEPEPAPVDPTPPVIETVDPPVAQPIPDQPSYKEYNLSAIPVPALRLVDVPFREALMQIVAESGFNVVVGDDIENTSVVLDFRQQEMSLREVLDIMRMAYDVECIVEDAALVFRSR